MEKIKKARNRESDCKYRETHREQLRESSRRFRKENKEKINKWSRKWYAAHREEERERHRKGYITRREQHREYNRKYNQTHRKEMIERNRKWYISSKERVYAHYGNVCIGCGETDPVVLTVDHINGGGSKHRKNLGAASIYSWLWKNNFPEGYRILCMNCQFRRKAGMSLPNENVMAELDVQLVEYEDERA